MANYGEAKRALVDEISSRIVHLMTTDKISDVEKIKIARKMLNLIEHGKKEEELQ